jgi:hypothetical protein
MFCNCGELILPLDAVALPIEETHMTQNLLWNERLA